MASDDMTVRLFHRRLEPGPWSEAITEKAQYDNPETAEKMTTAAAEYSACFAGVLAERRSCPRDEPAQRARPPEVDGDRLDGESMFYESASGTAGGYRLSRKCHLRSVAD